MILDTYIHTHIYICFIVRMLYALTPWDLWQCIQAEFSFIMSKKNFKGGSCKYDYLVSASREISMILLKLLK